jgi:hypothetical protein
MKIYTSSGWIAASSASVATLAVFEFVATGGQTTFTGTDANGQTLSYVAPALIVTLNGVRLRPGDDYTASNGTSIVLVSAAAAGDELVVDAFGNFLVANTYTIAQADALLDNKQAASPVLTSVVDHGMQFRNRIINGDMRIDQRNAGASVTINASAATYTLDRWAAFGQATDGVYTVQRSSTAPSGFTNSLLVTTTTADASIGASQFYTLLQRIEGFNVADLGWGTADAKTITISFWTRSSLTGTFGGSLRNGASNRSHPFTYTITAANTWEYKTVTVTGDTTGTWTTGNTNGLSITFSLGVGSTFSGTAGAWAGENYLSATGATSVVGTNGATWYVTGVQLEVGSVATPFERRPYGTELALCQRYYWNSHPFTSSGGLGFAIGSSPTSNYDRVQFSLPTTMRAAPTVSFDSNVSLFSSSGVNTAITAITANFSTTNMVSFDGTTNGTLVTGAIYLVYTATSSGRINASAEL